MAVAVEGPGVWLRVASSDGLLEGLVDGLLEGSVDGTWIPVAGSLRESPTNAKAATETAMANAIPANPSPTIVSVRFMTKSLAVPVLTPG